MKLTLSLLMKAVYRVSGLLKFLVLVVNKETVLASMCVCLHCVGGGASSARLLEPWLRFCIVADAALSPPWAVHGLRSLVSL